MIVKHDKEEDARHYEHAKPHTDDDKHAAAKAEQHAFNKAPRQDGVLDSINEPPGSDVRPAAAKADEHAKESHPAHGKTK